jgi:hypothetical protein
MNDMKALALLPLVLALAACGAATPESVKTTPESVDAAPAVGAPLLYEAGTMVLEDDSHGPELCLGGSLDSLPPQCGGPPVANWDWSAVEGEETRAGTTWGDFHVVGTYDGETFTLVEAGAPEPMQAVDEPEDEFDAACDEPAGGWVVPDHGRTTDMQADTIDIWAQKQPQYVASWITYLDEDVLEKVEAGNEGPYPIVFNLVVDRDADLLTAGALERWDGPLCVVERDVPTFGEAQAIRKEAEASLEGVGLQMLGSSEGGVGEAAEIWVVADPGGAGQAIMDERFGPGLIRLVPALVPVN